MGGKGRQGKRVRVHKGSREGIRTGSQAEGYRIEGGLEEVKGDQEERRARGGD